MNTDPYGLKRVVAKPVPYTDRFKKFVHYINPKIPAKKGVYFCFNRKGVIVYVGRATNLKTRIAAHVAEVLRGNSYIEEGQLHKVAWKLIEELHDLRFWETFYIYHLNPEYNFTQYQQKFFLNPEERRSRISGNTEEERIANLAALRDLPPPKWDI